MSWSFLSLWTHLSWCLPATGPSPPLLSVIVAGILHTIDDCKRSTCLWMSNRASGHWPLASLFFWGDVACSLVLNGIKPWGTHLRGCSVIQGQQRCAGWHSGCPFTWVSLCSRANRMHGRGGAKWAAIPSLTLVVQKMTHASSQSWSCFPVCWL